MLADSRAFRDLLPEDQTGPKACIVAACRDLLCDWVRLKKPEDVHPAALELDLFEHLTKICDPPGIQRVLGFVIEQGLARILVGNDDLHAEPHFFVRCAHPATKDNF
jgi:hypothetical protein